MSDDGEHPENLISHQCVRALLMLYNIVFWLSGLSLIWMGIWMRTDYKNIIRISSNYSEYGPYALIIIGIIIVFVSSLACTCIIKIQPSMLVVYGAFLITMLYTLISLSIYIYTYKDRLINGIPNGIRREMEDYEPHVGINGTLIDFIQNRLQCCGNESYLDWGKYKLPDSCCAFEEGDSICSRKSSNVHIIGCYYKLRHEIATNFTTVGVTTSAIAFFPLFGTVFAFALALIAGGNKMGYEEII